MNSKGGFKWLYILKWLQVYLKQGVDVTEDVTQWWGPKHNPLPHIRHRSETCTDLPRGGQARVLAALYQTFWGIRNKQLIPNVGMKSVSSRIMQYHFS